MYYNLAVSKRYIFPKSSEERGNKGNKGGKENKGERGNRGNKTE